MTTHGLYIHFNENILHLAQNSLSVVIQIRSRYKVCPNACFLKEPRYWCGSIKCKHDERASAYCLGKDFKRGANIVLKVADNFVCQYCLGTAVEPEEDKKFRRVREPPEPSTSTAVYESENERQDSSNEDEQGWKTALAVKRTRRESILKIVSKWFDSNFSSLRRGILADDDDFYGQIMLLPLSMRTMLERMPDIRRYLIVQDQELRVSAEAVYSGSDTDDGVKSKEKSRSNQLVAYSSSSQESSDESDSNYDKAKGRGNDLLDQSADESSNDEDSSSAGEESQDAKAYSDSSISKSECF